MNSKEIFLLYLFQVSKAIVDKAFECGLNFFDTAEVSIGEPSIVKIFLTT
jgi:diketogulonate reductase-like aldo/keto reductase